jgi:uncharacterized protein YcfL
MGNKLFFYAAGVLLMAACSSNDVDTSEPNTLNEIRLYTEVQTRAANVAADLQDIQFAANTEIKVQVTDNNTDANARIAYSLTTYKADGSGGLTCQPDGSVQYFPPTGTSVDIYAFHPADAATSAEAVTFSVRGNQKETADYVASDLMWASLSGITKTSTDLQRKLQFTHKLSKIIVSLVKGAGVSDGDLAASTVTLENVICKGTFTPTTGVFTAAEDAELNRSDIVITETAGTTAHAAIIVPQSVAGKKLTIAMGGGTQSYTIPAQTTFAAGKKYTYTVTVSKSGLSVTTSITDWTADGWTDPTPNIRF